MKVFPSKVSVTMASVFVLTLVLLISVFSVAAQTQAAGADLSGSVEDPNGAVVAGATVTARNLATGITRTVTSNSNGNYQFIALSPGEYEIITEAATFKKVSIAPVKLTVGQSAQLTIKMEIGAADAVVNVEGGSVEDERIEALVGDAEGAAPSRARDGAPRLVARLDPVTRTRAGARLTLGVDPDRVYLFDAASGDALAGARLDDAAAAPAPASPS